MTGSQSSLNLPDDLSTVVSDEALYIERDNDVN